MPTITQPQIQERRPPSVKASISPASLQLLNCLRASPQICQEPLFSSSGPLLFNLPRDSLLQLWIFSRASLSVCHQLLSSCLFCLRASSLICQEPLFSSSGPLLLNLPRDSSAALKLRPLMLNLCCEASLFLVSRHSPLEDTQFKPPKKRSCNGAGPFRLLISKRGGSRHKPN